MSVVSVSLRDERYEFDGSGYVGQRIYRVVMDNPASDDATTALSATDGVVSVPAIGATWGQAKAVRKSAAKVAEGVAYDVTVQYSSKSGDQPEEVENPLNRPWEYSYDDTPITEPYFFDVEGLPCANSAGEPFDTLPEREVTIGQITIVRNVASFDDSTAQGYRDKINSDSVTIRGTTYAAGQLRIRAISAQGPFEENGVTFWRETIVVAKKADKWEHKFEDRGYSELDEGKLKPILNADGEQVVRPWPLDGSGAAKASPTDEPATLVRKPYLATTLAGLLEEA